MNAKKVLITGGAGFIGSHLADRLIADGHAVVALDNLHLGRRENLAQLETHPRFRFMRRDVLEFDAIRSLFVSERFDRVYHLAANSDIAQGIGNRQLDLDLNFQTTRSVLEGMVAGECREIVFASSSAIYGEASGKLHEDQGPLFPVSFYGASKLSAEAYLSVYAHTFGFKTWIIRFPNVVGERATHGVVLDFINKLRKNAHELEVLGDGNQRKPYLYVKDLVDAIEHFIGHTAETLNYVNVGVETSTMVREIAEIVIQEMKVPATIRYTGGAVGWIGDVPRFEYGLDKIHGLGWKARMCSTEAVRTAVRAMLREDRHLP